MERENNMISFTKYIHNSKLYSNQNCYQNNNRRIVLDLDVVKEKQLVFKTTEVPTDLKTTEVPTDLHRYLDSETEDTDGDGYDPNNGEYYTVVYDDSPSNQNPFNLPEQ
tara:strand:+ start:696 stop:1022 length:327 start_codon:yes stop_codon:yes gene_type:complete